MKKTLARFSILVLGLMLAVTYASAGNVTLVITQNSFPSYNGGEIGPYAGTLNGSPALFTCLNLFLETTVGQPYTGSLIAATTTAEKEAVWLTDQENILLGQAHTPVNDTTTFGDLNWAIWNVMDPSGVDISGLPGAETDVANAVTAVASGLRSGSSDLQPGRPELPVVFRRCERGPRAGHAGNVRFRFGGISRTAAAEDGAVEMFYTL